MNTFNKALLWTATGIAAGFLFFPNYLSVFAGGEPPSASDSADVRTIDLEGLSCRGCSDLVRKAIQDVPGVVAVRVDYDKKTAVVTTQPCCEVPADVILAAIAAAGFKGSNVSLATAGQCDCSQVAAASSASAGGLQSGSQ